MFINILIEDIIKSNFASMLKTNIFMTWFEGLKEIWLCVEVVAKNMIYRILELTLLYFTYIIVLEPYI